MKERGTLDMHRDSLWVQEPDDSRSFVFLLIYFTWLKPGIQKRLIIFMFDRAKFWLHTVNNLQENMAWEGCRVPTKAKHESPRMLNWSLSGRLNMINIHPSLRHTNGFKTLKATREICITRANWARITSEKATKIAFLKEKGVTCPLKYTRLEFLCFPHRKGLIRGN